MCARIGGVLAPMMYLLRSISPHAPMVLCGLCPLLGSALTLLLPETANKPLPDTIEDIEGVRFRFGFTVFTSSIADNVLDRRLSHIILSKPSAQSDLCNQRHFTQSWWFFLLREFVFVPRITLLYP